MSYLATSSIDNTLVSFTNLNEQICNDDNSIEALLRFRVVKLENTDPNSEHIAPVQFEQENNQQSGQLSTIQTLLNYDFETKRNHEKNENESFTFDFDFDLSTTLISSNSNISLVNNGITSGASSDLESPNNASRSILSSLLSEKIENDKIQYWWPHLHFANNAQNEDLRTNENNKDANLPKVTILRANEERSMTQIKRRKSKRTRFNDTQVNKLEVVFQTNNYPDSQMIERLAESLNVSTHTVTVWFQNKRAKLKKDANISRRRAN